jgi:hypothetical protein
LQCFGHGEQIVDLEIEQIGQFRHAGAAVEGVPSTSSISPANVLVETWGRTMAMPVPGWMMPGEGGA